EQLPHDWSVDGTTGYDFMNAVSAVQHDPAGEPMFTELWSTLSGRRADFETEERRARRGMPDTAFVEAGRATGAWVALRSETTGGLDQAVALIIEHFRAYRTYALGDAPAPEPGRFFEDALETAHVDADADLRVALGAIASVMRGEWAACGDAARDAVRRF